MEELGRLITAKSTWGIAGYDEDKLSLIGHEIDGYIFQIPWDRPAVKTALIQTDDKELRELCERHKVEWEPFQEAIKEISEPDSKAISLSFSSINTFSTCPRQFEHYYLLKDFKSPENEANLWGTRCHKEIEDYLKEGKEIVDEAPRRALPLIAQIRKLGGQEAVEWKWGLKNWRPCGFFDEPELRGVIDWVVILGEKAVVVDWKFGKRKEDSDQLKLFALAVFLHYPEVQKVRTIYAWLKEGQGAPTVRDYIRGELEGLKEYWEGKVEEVMLRVEAGVFPARRSGLCRGWCGVKSCEHFGG